MTKKILENRNNRIMLVILIIGIAIIVISSAVSDGEPKSEVEAVQTVTQYYGEEEKLSEILREIDGVGEVSVMISYISTIEKDIVRDGDSGRAVTSGGDVVVKREVYPEVKGVVVIAEGADEPKVRKSLKEAVIAVTGVGANRVQVFKRSK